MQNQQDTHFQQGSSKPIKFKNESSGNNPAPSTNTNRGTPTNPAPSNTTPSQQTPTQGNQPTPQQGGGQSSTSTLQTLAPKPLTQQKSDSSNIKFADPNKLPGKRNRDLDPSSFGGR